MLIDRFRLDDRVALVTAAGRGIGAASARALTEFGPTFANADSIPLEPIPWLFIIPGFVIAALAGATLLPARRSARASAPVAVADTAPV